MALNTHTRLMVDNADSMSHLYFENHHSKKVPNSQFAQVVSVKSNSFHQMDLLICAQLRVF